MLDDPGLVSSEYTGPSRLDARMAIYGRAVEAALAAVVETHPTRVLDVGAGTGAFSARVAAVANWVLYHVPDRDRAIAEAARVLRPEGRLVAATFSERNLEEVWDALGDDTPRGHGFTAENGAAQLRRHFGRVGERPVAWEIAFPDPDERRRLIAANIRRAHLSDRVAHIDLPPTATARHTIFVAEGPRRSSVARDAD